MVIGEKKTCANRAQLQKIIFPDNDRFMMSAALFYQSSYLIYDEVKKEVHIAAYSKSDFVSYLNAFSLKKWKEYTYLERVILKLRIKGNFRLRLTSYRLNIETAEKTTLAEQHFYSDNIQEIELAYPETDDAILAFELETHSECILYSAGYFGEFAPDISQEVELSIVSTTFRKETFIRSNVKKICDELLSEPEVGEHVWVHVVDNGRTLSVDEFSHSHVMVHSNKNVGGSGGFARGMIETLHQPKKASHVLLMDDDILLNPECIRRTYELLRNLKPEYRQHFISGAMLCYEKMDLQHEDVGYVHKDGSYGPVKKHMVLSNLVDVLKNEEEQYPKKNQYAGWWYCCIPVDTIKKNGLPLPLFVRGDDVEFSLRNQAKFITMNGICVWHMGFTYKFSASMELYQVHRNSLIFQAISGTCQDIDFMPRLMKMFRARTLALDYAGADQVLDAIADYLKGPDFIAKDQGEALMKEHSAKNEQLFDLLTSDEVYHYPDNAEEIFYTPARRLVHTLIYRLTYNGHRFWPTRFLKRNIEVVPYDWFYAPERFYLRKQLLAVNPFLRQGTIRTLDKERFKSGQVRYKHLLKKFKRENSIITKQYRERNTEFTSEKFWKEYLGI